MPCDPRVFRNAEGTWCPPEFPDLADDTNLQVEASDGKQAVVSKSTTQMGIGTKAPVNPLVCIN